MLAYVFWHWPNPGLEVARFESLIAEYHKLLASVASEGFHGSAVFHVSGPPWLGPERAGYEEWYMVEASFALDSLNQVAVSEPLRPAHDALAQEVLGMTAGLYRLRSGEARLADGPGCVWLSKPARMTYAEFDSRVAGDSGPGGVSLWRRQMVLGPTPEFCLVGDHEPGFGEEFSALPVERRPVWPLPI